MVENKSIGSRVRVGVTYIIVILLTLLCLFPIWNMVCISFSSATMVAANKVTLFPRAFTLEAYLLMLKDSDFWRAFGVSVIRVILSLAINLTMIVLLAYPLSKTKREFNGRNIIMGFLVFAMLFSGGMIPGYLVVKELGLLNTIWALVLPAAVPISNTIMTMNFISALPDSLEEAAVLDGANPLQILIHLIIPCSKPSMATMALFSIVGNWNEFYSGLIYMTKAQNYPLMTYINSLQVDIASLLSEDMSLEALEKLYDLSGKNLNAAKVVVAVVPLMLIYPFLQKYLIHGIVMGAVKE